MALFVVFDRRMDQVETVAAELTIQIVRLADRRREIRDRAMKLFDAAGLSRH
ncbi:hypothetical protein OHA40_21430 [Nocardia sp. NBC_00508]|uniref:hypothetical protein n=1 Tax=Nocardia sp. NBC_00508 TaxID=2975992 RepID=UPI002E80D052|nr:hypothetical protein [Nocardia sp. NBC_00508]WUD64262.1 hypothetical protein OHA40_21430 [Nocardia sp. NBC_00508]